MACETGSIDVIEALNDQFRIPGHLQFDLGQGGLPRAIIENDAARGEIYLHGAHVTSFQPRDQADLLWMSSDSNFSDSMPIRGGIPICWPWFSHHPTDSNLPQHGFARISAWEVQGVGQDSTGAVTLQLGLSDSDATRRWWPHAFQLILSVTIGPTMTVELQCCNTGDQEFGMAAALHTYLGVSHISDVRVEGLAGRSFIDQLDDDRLHIQSGSLEIHRETDRIYIGTEDDVLVHDRSSERVIRVAKQGSVSTVIWNPWIDKSRRMADFPDDGYETMLCVETTNAASDERRISPGQEHRISQTIGLFAG